ncbi:MAG: FGGY-family carbohydrate kinase [Clostridium sp.]
MKILALESSTSSAKALIYDTSSKTSSLKIRPYPKMFENPTVHNAQTVFEEMLTVGRELLDGTSDIDMISLGGTWHSLCLFNQSMEAATPVMPWCYTGASDLCKEIREDKTYVHDYYHRTGCMVNAIYPFFKLRMYKKMGFDLNQFLIAGQGTYNTYQMTGERVITECMASGMGLLNIYTKRYDQNLLNELGITENQLPEIVTYEHTYPLRKKMADFLGLREGIPVIPSNADGGLNQIGVGALKKGVMTFSVGTSGAIRLTTSTPVIPEEPSIWCYLSPNSWLSGAATSGACNCLDWFKENFAKDSSYMNLEREFNPEDDSPVFLPFVFGERCPGWNDDRRGAFEHMNASHRVQDLYRGVQEGTLFNLYQCYETLTSINGEPKRIKLSGGILNSPLWTQMCADIFGKEMEVDQQSQSSLMGGVVLAMELLGVIDTIEDFNVEPTAIIVPNPERIAIYKKRYACYKEYYEKF